jgi:tetratricopeptide (TPR) repeat protein
MVASPNDLEKYYELLGVCRKASLDDLKAAYRLLARKWHPDLNPGDVDAHQRFIMLTQAYQILINSISARPSESIDPEPSATVTVTPKSPPQLSKLEAELKSKSYTQMQLLLKQERFLQAIGLIEDLKQRWPHDLQVCQWQGIVYARFAYRAIDLREFNKARIYLKKALKADPHNQQLWKEVNRAFNRIERAL